MGSHGRPSVEPVRAVELHDEADLWSGNTLEVRPGGRQRKPRELGGDRSAVAGREPSGVNGGPVGGDRKRAWRVGKHVDDVDRATIEIGAEVVCVVDPHVWRPTLGVVSWGSKGMFCPRCATVTKARLLCGPPNTISRGSSPTSSVRTTRDSSSSILTMLMLSDSKLATQTSWSSRRRRRRVPAPPGSTGCAGRSP